ncbi:MAG: hypothetical protein HF312_15695 [Ignavibacteria bacterium]|jgi:hypothetical protein|nr:hypothetical protein [Ignavibacteria bacterium]
MPFDTGNRDADRFMNGLASYIEQDTGTDVFHETSQMPNIRPVMRQIMEYAARNGAVDERALRLVTSYTRDAASRLINMMASVLWYATKDKSSENEVYFGGFAGQLVQYLKNRTDTDADTPDFPATWQEASQPSLSTMAGAALLQSLAEHQSIRQDTTMVKRVKADLDALAAELEDMKGLIDDYFKQPDAYRSRPGRLDPQDEDE